MKIVQDADNMINGFYCFDGLWDMEPCFEFVDNKKIRWDICYNGDFEWSYMFTRMDFLYKFIIAYEKTGNEKYLFHGLKIVNKWYKDNKKFICKYIGKFFKKFYKKNNLGYRTLDVSIMISNIVDYIDYCFSKKIISFSQYKRYKRIVCVIIDYILINTNKGYTLFNNWGIIENGNILYCLNKLNINKNVDLVCSNLICFVNNQINSNGSHIESSPMYLVQVLLVLLKNINCSNCSIKDDLFFPVFRGCCYIANISKLDNTIPNIGDSDLTNISDLMFIAGVVLKKDFFFNYVNRDLSDEFCFKYNISKKYSFKNFRKSICVKYLDQTIYRDEVKKCYLMCSNVSKKIDGHKHYDYMSILYSEFGKDILVDCGRFSYKNDSNRVFFKGPSAHNVICVDGYYKYIDSWKSLEKIECLDNKVLENKKWISIKMSCIFGYSDIIVSRYVTYVYELGLIITDVVAGEHETFFNIGDSFNVNIGDCVIISDGINNIYYFNDKNIIPKIDLVKYSKVYNECSFISQLCIRSSNKKITHCFFKKNDKFIVKYTKNTIKYVFLDDEIILNY